MARRKTPTVEPGDREAFEAWQAQHRDFTERLSPASYDEKTALRDRAAWARPDDPVIKYATSIGLLASDAGQA